MSKTKLLMAAALGAILVAPTFAADQPSREAGRPAQGVSKEKELGRYSGWEGKERELGLIMNMVYKTLEDNGAYQHEVNDALVKSLLSHMQFTKDHNLVAEGVQDEINTQSPMLKRVRKMIDKTGDKELALKAVFDQTTCHWQLVLDTEIKPGMRRFKSPYTNVLEQTHRMGQHDITEKWIHENWTIPRMKGYSEILGVELKVSPWQDDGMITVSVDLDQPKQTAGGKVSQ